VSIFSEIKLRNRKNQIFYFGGSVVEVLEETQKISIEICYFSKIKTKRKDRIFEKVTFSGAGFLKVIYLFFTRRLVFFGENLTVQLRYF
jgi:hypothetical protein